MTKAKKVRGAFSSGAFSSGPFSTGRLSTGRLSTGLVALGLIVGLPALSACSGDGDSKVANATAETAEVVPASTEAVEAEGSGLLNPNLAGEEELSVLPGLDAAGVAAILEGRPFLNMLALDAALAPHMDEAAREALYAHAWVPLDLNSATEEEILLVPGVGGRMAHEFEEYRPYDGVPRFRREIGKYVDDAEVERMARYVFVPIDLNTATEEEILSIPGVGPRMLHEFQEYRPYANMEQFEREIGKYVDDAELARLERYVTLSGG